MAVDPSFRNYGQQSCHLTQNTAGFIPTPEFGIEQKTDSHLTGLPEFKHNAVQIVCPHCKMTGLTVTERHGGRMAHIMCFLLIVTGCCCLIPFCLRHYKETDHRCSNCNCIIGQYKPSFNRNK